MIRRAFSARRTPMAPMRFRRERSAAGALRLHWRHAIRKCGPATSSRRLHPSTRPHSPAEHTIATGQRKTHRVGCADAKVNRPDLTFF